MMMYHMDTVKTSVYVSRNSTRNWDIQILLSRAMDYYMYSVRLSCVRVVVVCVCVVVVACVCMFVSPALMIFRATVY